MENKTLLFSAALMLAVGSVFADGPFKLTAGGNETTYSTLSDAVTALNAVDASTACVLEITEDATFSESVIIVHDKVTLRSAGDNIYTLKRTDANACIFFGGTWNEIQIPSSKMYTMDISNITVDGGAVWTSSDISDTSNTGVGAGKPLFFTIGTAYNQYGRLNFNAGATVQNVQTASDSNYDGAVNTAKNHSYSGNTGRIYLNEGSKITQCRGAASAVYVRANGTSQLTIAGGEICYCYSSADGGAVYVSGNSGVDLTMTGGSIHHCKATNGGGMYLSSCELKLSGGEIYSNVASTSGGGVYNNRGWNNKCGTFTGGYIYDNTAGTSGGGLYMNDTAKPLTLGGSFRIKGNTANSVVDNFNIASCTAANITINSLSDDNASIGLKLPNAVSSENAVFATAGTGVTTADLARLHLDTNGTLYPTVDGTDIKWTATAPVVAAVATVTTGGGSADYLSFRDALDQANAETAATVTLHGDVAITCDYVITGKVTLETDNANGITLSRSGAAELVIADGGELTMAGDGVTVSSPIEVADGATLAVATGASPSFDGAINLETGSTLSLAGAPAFAFAPVFPNAEALVLSGPLTGAITVSYPENGLPYKEVAFGLVANGYTPTAADLGFLGYAYAAAAAEVNNGTLRWSSGAVKVAKIGSDEYESFGEAIAAANLTDNATIELLRDITIDSRVCVNSSVTVTSAEGVKKITRTSSSAGFDIGKNELGETVIAKDCTLTFSNIIVDGGAVWSSGDLTDTGNTGIGAGQPLFTAVSTGSNSSLNPTCCGKLVFGSGAEIRNQAGQVAYLDYHTRFAFESGATLHDCRTWDGHLHFLRTSSFEFAGEVRNCTAGNTSTGSMDNYALFCFDKAGSNYWDGSLASMTGGSIHDCYLKTGAFSLSHTKFSMSGGEIINNCGGNGVAIHRVWGGSKKISLSAGVITNNTVEINNGAAIYVCSLKDDQTAGSHDSCLFLSGSIVIKDNWYKRTVNSVTTTTRRNIYSAREHQYLEQWYNVLIGGPLTGEVQVTWPENNANSYTTLAEVLDVPFGAIATDIYTPTQADAKHLVYEGSPVEGKQVVGRVDGSSGKLIWGLYKRGLKLLVR